MIYQLGDARRNDLAPIRELGSGQVPLDRAHHRGRPVDGTLPARTPERAPRCRRRRCPVVEGRGRRHPRAPRARGSRRAPHRARSEMGARTAGPAPQPDPLRRSRRRYASAQGIRAGFRRLRAQGAKQPPTERSNRWRSRRAARGGRASCGSSSITANARAPARATRAMSSASRASLRSGMPDCFSVEQRPSPRSRRSSSASSNPSVGPHHRQVDASLGLDVILVGLVEEHAHVAGARRGRYAHGADGVARARTARRSRPASRSRSARRHRPRSPSSRSADALRRREPLHDRVLVLRTHASVQELDVQFGEDLGRQDAPPRPRRPSPLGPVALVDRGAYDEPRRPAATSSRTSSYAADRCSGVRAARLVIGRRPLEARRAARRRGHRSRSARASSGWGRRHDQHVGLATLALQGGRW